MTIYEICWHSGEKSWICANSTIEAIHVYCQTKEMDFDEFDLMDDIKSLPIFKWYFYKVNGNQSFHQYMRKAIKPGLISENI